MKESQKRSRLEKCPGKQSKDVAGGVKRGRAGFGHGRCIFEGVKKNVAGREANSVTWEEISFQVSSRRTRRSVRTQIRMKPQTHSNLSSSNSKSTG